MPEQLHIYQVEAKGANRNTLLGYATGEKADIEAYFDARKAYGLILSLVVPKHIPAGYAAKRLSLQAQKEELQRQMLELDRQIALATPRNRTNER
jgi:hypothetical protein